MRAGIALLLSAATAGARSCAFDSRGRRDPIFCQVSPATRHNRGGAALARVSVSGTVPARIRAYGRCRIGAGVMIRVLFEMAGRGAPAPALSEAEWRDLLAFADRTQLTLYLR